MAISRQTVRGNLLTEMSSYYTVAEAGFDYVPDTFDGKFPVYAIESVAAQRPSDKFGAVGNLFQFVVHHFVLFAKPADGWTKENADDKLDEMELAWANFLAAKKTNRPSWRGINVLGPSVIVVVDIGGERYLDEQIPIQVEI